ncbi:A/G-specific adenine glycosylase [Conexibacter sp. SYSU D00693]|uniref:A/G-specific adenine glycosylase n=1 Tax=Conexibacter sp. SYSU D00693 TaxID=2812560 RepID=UPI001F11BA4B|nr:A/G-specific adenine glycosylase [Conexibacter sp. SYSU D00693]
MDPAVGALLEWYGREARDLPWRRTTDPYAILVSEVMLQQTQVARVVPRFEAWLEQWPDEAALAAAPLDEVLRAWVGLGYNRRAVRLREACAVVAREGWPGTAAGLRALPGVGPYTAAAVASFAFGQDVPAVDTNARRVEERLGRGTLDALLPAGDGPTFNQAVMELGATVCRARVVACDGCPVAAWCASAGRVVVAPRAPAGTRERFEDSDRWARGRVVAALAAGEGLPPELSGERLARALAGLERDGLVVRAGGAVQLAR